MKLQELLIDRGIDINETKLIRHNIKNEFVATSLLLGHFDIYQAIMRCKRYKNCKYILSFLSDKGTSAKFYGFYKVNGYKPFQKDQLPKNYPIEDINNAIRAGKVFWEIKKLDILSEIENKLIIEWGNSTRAWIQYAVNEKEIICILP